jgi:hypothetical protein
MPLSPVIVPPRAQASRRCETQAPLSGKPPSCAKRFGPLTPSARSGNLIVGDGTKNGLPAPNKELAINRKQPLDRKSPIQVRIRLPPAESHANFRFLTSGARSAIIGSQSQTALLGLGSEIHRNFNKLADARRDVD